MDYNFLTPSILVKFLSAPNSHGMVFFALFDRYLGNDCSLRLTEITLPVNCGTYQEKKTLAYLRYNHISFITVARSDSRSVITELLLLQHYYRNGSYITRIVLYYSSHYI